MTQEPLPDQGWPPPSWDPPGAQRRAPVTESEPAPQSQTMPSPWAPAPEPMEGAQPGGFQPGDPWSSGPSMAPEVAAGPSRKGSSWLLALLIPACLLVGALGGVAGGEAVDRLAPERADIPIAASGPRPGPPADSVAAVAAMVLPSTVYIEVRTSGAQGSGSGFVLREDGLILTNNHVVAEAAESGEINVVFSDGSQEKATIVGRTADYDLAVLKVEREGLTPLPLADSDAVVVGDSVVAVGAPLGLQATVTTGIVSALNRPVAAGPADDNAFINAIQTDAAINPGNSGGPLVNMSGQVIGINSAIARNPGTDGAGNIGLGFAIPAKQAARTAEQLIDTGRATYPIIGVLLDRGYAGEGVKVLEDAAGQDPVTPDGPAAQAGIRPGDVITGLNGRPMTEPDDLIVGIRAQEPGDTVTLTVTTGGGQEREVDVVLSEAESDD